MENNQEEIPFINYPMLKGSLEHKIAADNCEKVASMLEFIMNYNKNQKSQKIEGNNAFSPADEIRKFKALLDDGIISEEEFVQFKRRILSKM